MLKWAKKPLKRGRQKTRQWHGIIAHGGRLNEFFCVSAFYGSRYCIETAVFLTNYFENALV
jgi:hypothetical protein